MFDVMKHATSTALSTLPPVGGEGGERSEPGGGTTLAPCSRLPPTPDPSPPLASLAGGGERKCMHPPGITMTTDSAAPADRMVVYEGVSKFFPVRVRLQSEEQPELMVALDRIDASVRKGELVTLLGPSGCGKT